MHVLLCHHLESIWSHGYTLYNTSFAECVQNVADYVRQNPQIEKIIIVQYESDKREQAHEDYAPLFEAIDAQGIRLEWREYSYGFELEALLYADDEEIAAAYKIIHNGEIYEGGGMKIVQGGNHSSVLPLDKWIFELKQCASVQLCGAFEGECIEDIELAMQACMVNYQRVESLIVG